MRLVPDSTRLGGGGVERGNTRLMVDEKIGKDRILERIGRGGMGMIFKAHDPVLDRLVAVKVISPEVEVTDEIGRAHV